MTTILIFLFVAILIWVFVKRDKALPDENNFNGLHDCGPRALMTVLPDLQRDKVEAAFKDCSDEWPYGGVTNVEFTTVLRHLNLFELFTYHAGDNLKLSDFTQEDNKFAVLLITGHFTVIKNGKIFDTPNAYRSLAEIALVLSVYAALWVIAALLLAGFGWWASLPVSLVMSIIHVRIFSMFHDCTHRALFKSPVANEYAGHFIGIFSGTPYHVWQASHLRHHASIGQYDRRGKGDIRILTINEYKNAGLIQKMIYRLERNWMLRFSMAPLLYFMVYFRLPFLEMTRLTHWKSVIICNIGLVGFVGAGVMLFGFQAFLIIFTPTILVATALGAWFTYVQHQFENITLMKAPNWRIYNAAFFASSYYPMPGILEWMTGNVSAHHVHHLCSRIPFYRLPQVLRDYPELKEINRLTIRDSLKTIRLNIWDDDKNKLVSFRESGL
tara:strand:+ start:5835 stop:7157 length:1323 start_codon:yes stop_codon:yes gene_type:complete